MLGDVTRRPRTGQPPGAQSDGSVRSRQIPADSSPVATTVTPTAPSAWSAGPLAGDVPTERHRLPARVTRYWRWRAFTVPPFLVLLVSGAIVLPWGPWWIRWGVVAVFMTVSLHA
jgi:hypothetical protein